MMTTMTKLHERVFPLHPILGETCLVYFLAPSPVVTSDPTVLEHYFTMVSGFGNFVNITTLREIFEELPLTKAKNWIDIERLSNQIAKDTLRGKGNVIFYNNTKLNKIMPHMWYDFIRCPFLDPNEIVLTYIGTENDYDAGLVRISRVDDTGYKKTLKNWVKHPDHEKYFKRIIIEGADNIE